MAEAPKKKGIADIVFLLDVSGSMQDCIDAVKGSVTTFINQLAAPDANNALPIKDWRVKVCGFRDQSSDSANWWVDNPFVRDAAAIQEQLTAANMQASGGGDEPESLLDALYKVANMGESGVQDGELPDKWRDSRSAVRAVVCFTDATFKSPMTLPEANGGTVSDVITTLTANKIVLLALVPEWDGYNELGLSTEPKCISLRRSLIFPRSPVWGRR